MNRFIVLVFALGAVLVVGCEEPKATGGATTGGMAAAPVELTDKDLPLPADFDDEAEKDITSANYKAQLDALEKEIATE